MGALNPEHQQCNAINNPVRQPYLKAVPPRRGVKPAQSGTLSCQERSSTGV